MSADRVPVLLYHSVASSCNPRFRDWAVTPEEFAAQMTHLADRGYRSLTVRQLVERVFERGEPLDPGTVVITFDDGFADFHELAWPELRRNGLAATIFMTTGYVGRTAEWLKSEGEGERPMMDWAQIEEIHSAGIECGAHGHEHLQLDTVSATRAETDIRRSKARLEEAIGPVTSFAYPHGYYTRRVQAIVAEAGFSSACGVKDALSATDDDRFALARVIVRGGMEMDSFERAMSGDGFEVAPGPRRLRRGVWRAVRRANALSASRRAA
jgi:peptidoglycan/xylan/chitin deacetylase (PgdA/CDA1 family)